jgi:microcystin-dependent protein
MGQPFVGQIILVGFNFAPAGWLTCDGRLVPISEYETLFQLIGTTYGGDGEETFRLPDLQGRVPMGMGMGPGLSTRAIGEQGGSEELTLTTNQLPSHTHAIDIANVVAAIACRTGAGNSVSPGGNIPAGEAAGVTMTYSSQPADTNMGAAVSPGNSAQTGSMGGSQAHTNMQPYLVMQYCISAFGIYPNPP